MSTQRGAPAPATTDNPVVGQLSVVDRFLPVWIALGTATYRPDAEWVRARDVASYA